MLCLAWTMALQVVCPSSYPSVCPSVTRRYTVKTPTYILKLFFTAGYSHRSSFFHAKRNDNVPTGPPPLTGASIARRYEKSPFSTISRFISEIIQDRAIVTMEAE